MSGIQFVHQFMWLNHLNTRQGISSFQVSRIQMVIVAKAVQKIDKYFKANNQSCGKSELCQDD